MKKYITIIFMIFLTGCSFIDEKLGDFKISRGEKLFYSQGVTVESLESTKEGLVLNPENMNGKEVFKLQAIEAQKLVNQVYYKDKKDWTIEDFEKIKVYIKSIDLYDKLPLEIRNQINLQIDDKKYTQSKEDFIHQIKSRVLGNTKKISREKLKSWYRLIDDEDLKYNFLDIKNELEKKLRVDVVVRNRSFFYDNFRVNRILNSVMQREEGKKNNFVYLHRDIINGEEIDVVIDLKIDDIGDRLIRREEIIENKTLKKVLEHREVFLRGEYEIFDINKNKLITREYFSRNEDYSYELRIDGSWSIRDRERIMEKFLERELEDIIEEATWRVVSKY